MNRQLPTKRDVDVPLRANCDALTQLRNKARMLKPRRVIAKKTPNGRTLEHVCLSSTDSRKIPAGHTERYHATKGWRFERSQ